MIADEHSAAVNPGSAESQQAVLSADLAVSGVVGFSTTRLGGYSRGCFASWNLGDHVGDTARSVKENRALLNNYLPVATTPRWLKQVHGNHVVPAHAVDDGVEADAAWTDRPGIACAVMTADCLPILLASDCSPWVAAVHGGWRGLAAGVIEATIAACPYPVDALHAWLGPAIGPLRFEVKEDVIEAFTARYGHGVGAYFEPLDRAHWGANLYGIAREILNACGVKAVEGGNQCTYTDETQFFSYRRDGQTGRMATVIALQAGAFES